MPTWQPTPHNVAYQDDLLMTDDGRCIARVEAFGYACYPCAISAATGNLERGGPYHDRVAAMQWAERVAGLHPAKPGDERPPFYYHTDDDRTSEDTQ
jgi:hypothetical protein